jgi:hypothetical protein
MRVRYSMRKALESPFAFGGVMAGSSRYGWRVILLAAAGEELTDDERAEFKRLTGRDREPGRMCRELIAAVGRRGGKTQAATVFAAWIAIYCDHRDVLAPGEVGVVLVISRDQRAAKIVLDYLEGMLRSVDPERSPLPGMIANRTAESIVLANGISIEVRPCNRVSVRGPTYVAAICDEIAFWFTEVNAANPDVEILAAVRPGLMTTGGPLLMASSVYAQRGALYDGFRKYYGPGGPADIIVTHATSRDLNPSLPQDEIERELEKDPVRNRAEYLSEWRADVEGFIPREIVEACVADYYELPPNPGICYRCFVDAASGVPEGDSFAAVVSHKLGDRVVIDAIREVRPPFSPSEVVQTVLLPLCKTYSITSITGDNYAGEYPKELVRGVGISYELAKKHKSDLYVDPFLPLMPSRKIDFPRHERGINQICSLERSVQKSGRDQITHPPHGHDDIANAIAGAADLAFNFTLFDPSFSWVDGVGIAVDETDAQRRERLQRESDDWHAAQLRNHLAQHGAFGFGPPWGAI